MKAALECLGKKSLLMYYLRLKILK